MVDIHQLIMGLTKAIRSAAFPDATDLAQALHLDMEKAEISKIRSDTIIIRGARLGDSSMVADVVCAIAPWREIWLIFKNSLISYLDVKDETFGVDQEIKRSKLSAGFGVVFKIDGLTCGYTVSSPEGNVDSVFCEERAPAPSA